MFSCFFNINEDRGFAGNCGNSRDSGNSHSHSFLLSMERGKQDELQGANEISFNLTVVSLLLSQVDLLNLGISE